MGSSGRTSGGGSKEQLKLDLVEFVGDMRGDVNISSDKKDQVCEGIQILEQKYLDPMYGEIPPLTRFPALADKLTPPTAYWAPQAVLIRPSHYLEDLVMVFEYIDCNLQILLETQNNAERPIFSHGAGFPANQRP